MKTLTERLERVDVTEYVSVPGANGEIQKLPVRISVLKDPKDGEIYFDADAIAALDKARARHSGLLSPQQLAELRHRFGLTQEEISDLLQIGSRSWSRWETGREVLSKSINLLLSALHEGKIDLAYLKMKRALASGVQLPAWHMSDWSNILLRGLALPHVAAEPVSAIVFLPRLDGVDLGRLVVNVCMTDGAFYPPADPSLGDTAEVSSFEGMHEQMPLCA
jgi:DNA-binding transcriptional regulator YiaG